MILANFFDDCIDFFEVGIFAARTFGGVGKHSDFWLFAVVSFKSVGGIFNDTVEFFGVWEFVNAAVGEDKVLIFPFTDEATREETGF